MGYIYSWFEKSMEFLKPGGLYIFEFGWNQHEKVNNFLKRQIALKAYKIYKDKMGQPRMAVCFKKG